MIPKSGNRFSEKIMLQQNVMAQLRWLRKSSTPALNILSPTASMWSRSGISSAHAPGMRAANSCAEPATLSSVPTATRTGTRMPATCSLLSVWREPRMQAASAFKSDLVCSANERNERPVGSRTSASERDPTGRSFRSFAEQTKSELKALAACMRGSRQTLSSEQVAGIRVPVLVAVGTEDKVAGSAQELAALIPGAWALDIPDRDHMLAVGDKVFKAGVLDFLNQRN